MTESTANPCHLLEVLENERHHSLTFRELGNSETNFLYYTSSVLSQDEWVFKREDSFGPSKISTVYIDVGAVHITESLSQTDSKTSLLVLSTVHQDSGVNKL